MKTPELHGVVLSVPGGLAGQFFALCYGFWIAHFRGIKTHLEFYDIGTDISGFSIGSLLETESTKSSGISYSELSGSLNWSKGGSKPAFNSILLKVRGSVVWKRLRVYAHSILQHFYRARKNPDASAPGVITRDSLQSLSVGSRFIGYPADYRVIQEAWPFLPKVIAQSGLPDFSRDTGLTDSVAIHWRLGDYVNNRTHGVVAWSSIVRCIEEACSEDLPIRLFTDSPDLAMELIGDSMQGRNFSVVCTDIWSDLYEMTRSKNFIGSHSGVSFLAALAIRSDNPNAKTWLPDKWFLDEQLDTNFIRPVETFGSSIIYPANLYASKY